MSRSLETRLERLEDRGKVRPGLGLLQETELEALLEALKEEDQAARDAKFAAIELRPESERALAEFMAELAEHDDGKH
jgi:hypothetical protein